MPFAAKRHCPHNHPPFEGRRCPRCSKELDIRRGNSTARGYDWEWKKFSKAFLELYPDCSIEGCKSPAVQVDHIIALAEGGAKLDPKNCRGFCASHHSQRTGRDQVKNQKQSR